MKKITFLSLFLMSLVFASAQTNLLTNPGFETWTNGTTPDGWVFDKTTATLTKETSILMTGTSSLKVAATGTYWVTQYVPVTPGKTYTYKLNYYIGGGDGTDFRTWSNFCTAAGGTSNTFAVMNLTDSLALKGPGGNVTSAYFPNVTGSWQSYTYDVTAPAGYNYFQFQVRVYTGATVYLDDLSFTEVSTNVTNPSANKLSIWLSEGKVNFEATTGETVDVYNAVGQKLLSQPAVDGRNAIAVDNKGLTIVKIGNRVGKVVL